MKKIVITIFVLLISSQIQAQEAMIVPDSLSGWSYSWVTGLNGSQAAYSNWSQGGVNNIALSGNSSFTAKHREDRFSYGFLLAARYGKSKIEKQGIRKTSDQLVIKNRFLYELIEKESNYSAYANINFRTQFDDGFEYDAGPDDNDVLISGFMSPAYFQQGSGIAYIPTDYFSAEAGLALKQTIVTDDNLVTNYGLEPGDTIKNEGGLTLGLAYEQSIAPNFLLSSTVETFTNVNKSLSGTDVYFANELTGKVNDLISTSLRFDLAYDDDFSEEVQLMQTLSLGVSFILM
ncbi:DUF3078 domain-containing protein [Fodinibius sediminis]|uniref:DUF3078 domain-containing protein n=1 Tax=Fodinibius sediminis TaxID=1214077 RepID=A0A521CZ71_9BACT|nr:DUF3078 domain-containing protein [Fodinibius sediminis]SMO64746.1 Protein of unknown function [Fodinibius sediminis]